MREILEIYRSGTSTLKKEAWVATTGFFDRDLGSLRHEQTYFATINQLRRLVFTPLKI